MSIYPRYDDEECEKLHLVSPSLLISIVSEKKPKIIEIKSNISRFLHENLGEDWFRKFFAVIEEDYQTVFEYPDPHDLNGKYFLFELKS